MFPKLDYLFNIALVFALGFMGIYLGFKLINLIGV
jgi:hypothetical protein